MASKEPSIIRSTKSFSVEIPEGSSSAKAKSSDIVAGELGEIVHEQSHFEEQLAQTTLKQNSENESIDTQQSFAAENVKADVYAHVQEDALHESMAGISPDHLQSLPGIGVAVDSLKDHLVSVVEEHAKHGGMGISDDALNEHLVAISNESLHDTHAVLPSDKVGEGHHVAVPEPAAPIPLFVNANDDFPDDHMEIEDPPEENLNTQALTDESLIDHVEHVEEEKAKLAEVQLIPGTVAPLLTTQAKPVAQPKQPQLVKKAPAVLTPEMVKHQQEALIARQHRMEEFHGRVDAIRKTVSDINSKLDHISPQEKKNH
jgi:hypothetical protein